MDIKSQSKTISPILLLGPVLLLALGILGLTVLQGYRHLRQTIITQMENRDGEILDAVALSEQFGIQGTNLVQRMRDPGEQLVLALQISRIKDGVLGVRLFSPEGKFITAVPPNLNAATLSPGTLAALQQLHPVSQYDAAARLGDLFLLGAAAAHEDTLPLQTVTIPLHAQGETQLLACAQLLLDAHEFARQSDQIEHHLRLQALGLFALGGALLAAALAWAGYRLQKAHRLVQERTVSLLRANHELMLAAKTNALGAVTAHLIHGLSNPLANLQDFVSTRTRDQADGEWEEAERATRRMRQLLQEVVRVLGEENGIDAYEITLTELILVLRTKIKPMVRELKVDCQVDQAAQGIISNHPANIVLLILENLIHNALQVTPAGKTVRVTFLDGNDGVICRVADEGPGFPANLLKNTFAPCRSTKGGAGLGLAISKQLASHLGARLDLRSSSPTGSVVELTLPPTLFISNHVSAIASQSF
jgi:signal transduction histidine kinase